ncbi:MAG TPA: type II toxin-antitoxin system VapC family toxin [Candidatus Thermoplasmatota archaeon]|nr:type II toxin-antitoxin system VapC family toxin [Candidatus Thermoplasmatota archaeon]
MNVLPDTSFLVDLLRGRKQAVDLWEQLAGAGAVAHLSPLVLFELRFGFLWRGDRLEEAEFEAVAASMPLAELSEHAASHAAEIQVQMMRKGIPLGQLDALIAGTAAAGRYVLVTADQGLARIQQAGIPVRAYGP